MKLSPLQLESPTYPTLSVRSVPGHEKNLSTGPLPIAVSATVLYDGDGKHFAYLAISQSDSDYPYLVDIEVFASFTIDTDGCRKAYKGAFNPQVVAVNVARILYSGAREMLGLLTSRGPHGGANLPSMMIEPEDVDIEFEREKVSVILVESFGLTPEAADAVLAKISEVDKPLSEGKSVGAPARAKPPGQKRKLARSSTGEGARVPAKKNPTPKKDGHR